MDLGFTYTALFNIYYKISFSYHKISFSYHPMVSIILLLKE